MLVVLVCACELSEALRNTSNVSCSPRCCCADCARSCIACDEVHWCPSGRGGQETAHESSQLLSTSFHRSGAPSCACNAGRRRRLQRGLVSDAFCALCTPCAQMQEIAQSHGFRFGLRYLRPRRYAQLAMEAGMGGTRGNAVAHGAHATRMARRCRPVLLPSCTCRSDNCGLQQHAAYQQAHWLKPVAAGL